MTSSSPGRMAHWVPAIIVLATLLISAIRGLGHETYGPFPALARLEPVKFIDPLLVLAFGGMALLNAFVRRVHIYPTWKVRWAGAAATVLLIGVMSALLAGVPPYYAAQSIWFVLRPAVLLLVLTGYSWDGRLKPWLIGLVVAFSVANAAIVIAQWLALGAAGPDYPADNVIGLFHDAHQQATFGYTVALLSLAAVAAVRSWPRRVAWVGLVALNVVGGFISQGQKATGIEAGVLVAALAVLVLRSRTRMVRVVTVVPVVALAAFLVVLAGSGAGVLTGATKVISGNLAGRLEEGGYRGLALVKDIGVVRMFADFGSLSAAHPMAIVIGLGPSNYGSPAALTRLDRGDATATTRELFWWERMKEIELVLSGELRLLGLSAKTSLPGVVLGEYGYIALIAFLYLLIWPLFIAARAPVERRGVAAWGSQLFWMKVAYLGVIVQAAISTLGSWDNDVVLTLLLVGFAGVLEGRARSTAASPGLSSS